LGLDFSFNVMRDVKRVDWQASAPWFREAADGLNWFCYCSNSKCAAHHQLVVVPRGFSLFRLSKEQLVCPVCHGKDFELRNVGFVNCEWTLKGKLLHKSDSRVFGEGLTYDGKLYTFKETAFAKTFDQLEIQVKRLKDRKIVNDSKVYTSSFSQNESVKAPDSVLQRLKKIKVEEGKVIVVEEHKHTQSRLKNKS